jgi:ketosteroid isomerase-like protein
VSLTAFNAGELQRFTQAFEDLFYAADPASMTSYYTEHAQLMADGIQPIQGHAAITEFWRAAISRAEGPGPGGPSGCTNRTPRATSATPCAR